MITSNKQILYNNGDFKNDRVVGQFVADHRALRTALFGSMMGPYDDPCTCCIPAYGPQAFEATVSDPAEIIKAIEAAVEKQEVPDLLFVGANLYQELLPLLAQIAPDMKVIASCDRDSSISASSLRQQGIPAIDFEDYMRCAPLNAVIALTVFDELMTAS